MRAVFVLVCAMFLFACEEDSPDERESSRGEGVSSVSESGVPEFTSVASDIRIEDARWREDEIMVRGEVEGGGYVIFCGLLEGESRDVAEESRRHDAEASGVQVVGDVFVYTFVESEGGWDSSLEYWVYCALSGGGGEGPNSFSDPYDEAAVEGEPPKE